MHYTAIRCFTKELHKSNNYITLFTSFALQRSKFCNFLKLLSYRHAAESLIFYWGDYCFTEGFSFSAMTHRRMVSTMSGRV